MQVTISPRQLSPELYKQINEYVGRDGEISVYRYLRYDTKHLPAALAQALEDAVKVDGSGVTAEFAPNLVKPPSAAVNVKPVESAKPVVPDEGGLRLREHISQNGLLPVEANTKAIKDWFAKHPDVPWNAVNVDVCIFRELEPYLLWQPNNANHMRLVLALNPTPPPTPAPAPKPAVKPAEPPKPRVESPKEFADRVWREHVQKQSRSWQV